MNNQIKQSIPLCEDCKKSTSNRCNKHLNPITETRKKNKGEKYWEAWPSFQKTLTGKPVGRPKKEKDDE